jgi:hypothetical protein
MKTILKRIIEDKEIYARFLNTLSLLEYVGARKILKSQSQDHIDEKVLAHISEELRHAQVLKRVALKNAPGICQTYAPAALFCGKEAFQYFQAVDQAVEKILYPSDLKELGKRQGDESPEHSFSYVRRTSHLDNTPRTSKAMGIEEENRWHAYLLTTLLIELRATDFYQIFESVLVEMGQTVFRGILIEEEKHLHDVTEWSSSIPRADEKIAALKIIEEKEFAKFLQAIEVELQRCSTGISV